MRVPLTDFLPLLESIAPITAELSIGRAPRGRARGKI